MYAELNEKIIQLMVCIDKITDGLLSTDSGFSSYVPEFIQLTTDIFPKITLSYIQIEELKNYVEDTKYWSNLFNKIIDSIKGEDKYKIIDVLYFETKGSLYEYQELIRKIGFIYE